MCYSVPGLPPPPALWRPCLDDRWPPCAALERERERVDVISTIRVQQSMQTHQGLCLLYDCMKITKKSMLCILKNNYQ